LRSVLIGLIALPGLAVADEYDETIGIFRRAESGSMFDSAYGYAVFPTIGKAGFIVGGAYGKGRVYERGVHVGNVTMTQLTVGYQLGAQGYAMVIFLQDKRAFDEFIGGSFEFNAQATATAITAGASAGASTTGAHTGISGGKNDASATGGYYRGMAVYTIARGGLMAELSVGGQKFSYRPAH
jgi:lipid-binding SYLF domain-containing protein